MHEKGLCFHTFFPSGSLAVLLLAIVCMLSGTAFAGNSTPPTYQRVPTPHVSLVPNVVTIAPGGEIEFTALAEGGEAILFSLQWNLIGGANAGLIQPDSKRRLDGSYHARYVAPDAPGTYQVEVSLKEFPAATTTATIHVVLAQ
jgi:hypothetical protein